MTVEIIPIAENDFVIPAQAGIHDYRALKRLSDQWTPAPHSRVYLYPKGHTRQLKLTVISIIVKIFDSFSG